VCESLLISIISLGAATVAILIAYKAYKISLRNREKPRIKKLIDELKEARRGLSEHINHFNIFEFPESLNYRYDLPFDNDLYKKLSRVNRFTYSKINRYSESGELINGRIKKVTNEAKEQELIEKTKAEDGSGQKWTFNGRYKKLNQANKGELLQKQGLGNSIEDISTRVEKLIVEAKKLDKKLEKKILKLEKTYFTEYN